MIWLLLILLGLAVPPVVVVLVGLLLPREHEVRRSVDLALSQAELWKIITDFKAQARWHPLIQRVERAVDRTGRELWREIYSSGQVVVLETEESYEPKRLVRKIADDQGPFTGSWSFEIDEIGEACRLRLTESGRVENPFFRFVSRYIVGQATYVEGYLEAIGDEVRQRQGEA